MTTGKEGTLDWAAAGRGWAAVEDLVDRVLQPLEDRIVAAVAAGPAGPAGARRVLDVGCGTGGTTLALARRLGAACTGVDVSPPMIAAARARAEREGVAASFVQADAQRHEFPEAGFDAVVSRFGVMFFDDPAAAFANLRRAAAAGAGLHCVAWRSAAENPFMTAAERAAAPLLDLPARPTDGPGQFAFADAARVRRILEAGGWPGIDVRPLDAACALPASELERYVTRLGPVGRALEAADAATRARVVETVLPAFAPYRDGADIRFTAACWMIEAAT